MYPDLSISFGSVLFEFFLELVQFSHEIFNIRLPEIVGRFFLQIFELSFDISALFEKFLLLLKGQTVNGHVEQVAVVLVDVDVGAGGGVGVLSGGVLLALVTALFLKEGAISGSVFKIYE